MPKVYREEAGALVWLPNATGNGSGPTVTRYGMAVTRYPWTSDSYAQALDRYVTDCGEPQILRCYDGGTPAGNDITAHYQVEQAINRGWAFHYSFKIPPAEVAAGNHDTALEEMVASVPDGKYALLTYYHEPENDSFSSADWKAASERWANIVMTNRRDAQQVHVGPVLMGWTLDPDSGRNIADWLDPGTTAYDFLGWDEYNFPSGSGGTWNSFESIWTKISDYMDASQPGMPQVCAETGTQADSSGDQQARADWLTAAETYADGRGDFLAFEYFDSDVGVNGDWWLRRWNDGTSDWAPDQPSMDAYRAIQDRHR